MVLQWIEKFKFEMLKLFQLKAVLNSPALNRRYLDFPLCWEEPLFAPVIAASTSQDTLRQDSIEKSLAYFYIIFFLNFSLLLLTIPCCVKLSETPPFLSFTVYFQCLPNVCHGIKRRRGMRRGGG